MRRVVAMVQARMGSSRLRGKVLRDLAGEPVLARVVRRAGRAATLDDIAVVTTTQADDEPVVDLCQLNGWAHFRGSEDDVLDRYYQAAKRYRADVIVRVTADCPLIDPEVIDRVVGDFIELGDVDYAGNTRFPPRSFPVGLDVDVMAFSALERAWQEDTNAAWREHVAPYIYRNPDMFRLHSVVSEVDNSHMRWAVDRQEDLDFVRLVYSHFSHDRFSSRDVLDLLDRHPEWLEINRHVEQLHGWQV